MEMSSLNVMYKLYWTDRSDEKNIIIMVEKNALHCSLTIWKASEIYLWDTLKSLFL